MERWEIKNGGINPPILDRLYVKKPSFNRLQEYINL